MVAVSPQTPDKSFSTVEVDGLAFPVLSDTRNHVARLFRLVFRVTDVVYRPYEGFGINLEAANGDPTHELPMPGTYVIDRDGTIRFAYVYADYRVRTPVQRLLQVLHTMKDASTKAQKLCMKVIYKPRV